MILFLGLSAMWTGIGSELDILSDGYVQFE